MGSNLAAKKKVISVLYLELQIILYGGLSFEMMSEYSCWLQL